MLHMESWCSALLSKVRCKRTGHHGSSSEYLKQKHKQRNTLCCRISKLYVMILIGRPLYIKELVIHVTANVSGPNPGLCYALLRYVTCTAWPSGLSSAVHIYWLQDKLTWLKSCKFVYTMLSFLTVFSLINVILSNTLQSLNVALAGIITNQILLVLNNSVIALTLFSTPNPEMNNHL